MKVVDARRAAADAAAPRTDRPATTIVHDSTDARLVVFRIDPGQQVAPHTSPSTVMLTVLSGTGVVSGADGEQAIGPGAVVTYEPDELHGMRATADAAEPFVLLATIAPRPGTVPQAVGLSSRRASAA
jgi:quercetin dioxygenase-like cupin family protein